MLDKITMSNEFFEFIEFHKPLQCDRIEIIDDVIEYKIIYFCNDDIEIKEVTFKKEIK